MCVWGGRGGGEEEEGGGRRRRGMYSVTDCIPLAATTENRESRGSIIRSKRQASCHQSARRLYHHVKAAFIHFPVAAVDGKGLVLQA